MCLHYGFLNAEAKPTVWSDQSGFYIPWWFHRRQVWTASVSVGLWQLEERVRVKVPGGVMDPTYYTLVGHFFIFTFSLEKWQARHRTTHRWIWFLRRLLWRYCRDGLAQSWNLCGEMGAYWSVSAFVIFIIVASPLWSGVALSRTVWAIWLGTMMWTSSWTLPSFQSSCRISKLKQGTLATSLGELQPWFYSYSLA